MPSAAPLHPAVAGRTRVVSLSLLAGSAPASGPRLVGLSGPGAGRTVPAVDGLRLARAPDADVPLVDPWASRGGVQLTRAGGALRALDLGGRGARVNGRRIPSRGRALRPGDTLALGRSAWRFEDDPPPAPAKVCGGGHAALATSAPVSSPRAARAALGAALALCAVAAAAAAGWP